MPGGGSRPGAEAVPGAAAKKKTSVCGVLGRSRRLEKTCHASWAEGPSQSLVVGHIARELLLSVLAHSGKAQLDSNLEKVGYTCSRSTRLVMPCWLAIPVMLRGRRFQEGGSRGGRSIASLRLHAFKHSALGQVMRIADQQRIMIAKRY
jgi:hypothetical protein